MNPEVTTQNLLDGVARLTELGVIRVEGSDAASFLQGQLTQDFVLLKPGEARLAAFCSAKGRMQASFVGFKRQENEMLLICNQVILQTTLKRLSMFVMRATAKLTDASADFSLYGLAGSAVQSAGLSAVLPWQCNPIGNATAISLYPARSVPRALWVAANDAPAPLGETLAEEQWRWGEVQSGVATINAKTVDAFVPQMLNYESVGGVNFKKGCYPGQEVVARSQFRGTLKRRAYLVHGDEPMAAGDAVFGVNDAEQACGMVAQSARSPFGGYDAIASMQVAAAAAGGLTLQVAGGAALALQPLPYELLDDI